MSRVAAITTRSLDHEAIHQSVAVPIDTLMKLARLGVRVEFASFPLARMVLGVLVMPPEADLVEVHAPLSVDCEGVVPLTVG